MIPHLLVPTLIAPSLRLMPTALVLNLGCQRGENRPDVSTADHVRVLREYAPMLKPDVVVADPSAFCDDTDDLIVAAEELWKARSAAGSHG